MKDFISGLQENSTVIPPPPALLDIKTRFQNPINIEWFFREDHFEAIFYSDAREQIAIYSVEGSLINYKINISPPVLPGNLFRVIEKGHEIMNVVKIVKADDSVSYEIITRDNELSRYLVFIESSGKITLKKTL